MYGDFILLLIQNRLVDEAGDKTEPEPELYRISDMDRAKRRAAYLRRKGEVVEWYQGLEVR